MYHQIRLIVLGFLIVAMGCGYLPHLDEVLALKSVSDSQLEMDKTFKKQAESFHILVKDIQENRLKKNISISKVIKRYGEPVFHKKVVENTQATHVLLYWKPSSNIRTDKIYLYFDHAQRLVSWEYKPYPPNS